MACQIVSKPARTSASGRHCSSLRSITPLIGNPWRSHSANSVCALVNGSGSWVSRSESTGRPASSAVATKPPPTEK